MLSKKEIEEYKEVLYDLINDENVYNSIKKAVTGTFEYIEQLETKEQKLIEKLEKDIAEYPDAKYTKWYLADCLKIVKGENDEG